MLYWCEGSKSGKGALTFGNSDPKIIELFLRLLRQVYNIDENKLRCTVQCRYGQNTLELERFWRKITGIPKDKFYPTVIDERTKGKPLKKKNYKGVCRIDCFSANIYHELMTIPKVFE
jgi:phage-related protein